MISSSEALVSSSEAACWLAPVESSAAAATSVRASLAKEEARAAELEEYRVYVQTKQYIEKVAKEKLGLVNKDEILFKADESN